MLKSRLLVVEDDQALRLLLLHSLGKQYLVHLAQNLAEAYQVIDKQKIDLAVIDRILPDGDGLELISYLRDNSFTTRTIIISHKGLLADRIDGLEIGADDYISKPFGPVELILRIKRLIEKEKLNQNEVIDTLSLRVDLNSGLVIAPSLRTRLRRRELQILVFLMRRRNQVVDRQSIIAGVWGAVAAQPTTASLDVYVRRIRLHLGKYSGCVKTYRSYGYAFYEEAG